MEKNITAFVYKYYIFFNTKNFILRVLGLFLVSYSAIVCVEIGSPYGFDSIGFISKNELPYTLALTLSAVLVSFWEFDGNAIYAENNFFIILKMCMYFLIIPIELFILAKWIVPKCSHKTNNKFNSLKYIFGVPGVVLFRLILMNNQGNIDIPSLLRTVIFAFAVITLINSIYYFTQAFFAKKYSLDILTDYTETYINSIRRL